MYIRGNVMSTSVNAPYITNLKDGVLRQETIILNCAGMTISIGAVIRAVKIYREFRAKSEQFDDLIRVAKKISGK